MSHPRPPFHVSQIGAKFSVLRDMGQDEYERRVAIIEDLRRKNPGKNHAEIGRMLTDILASTDAGKAAALDGGEAG